MFKNKYYIGIVLIILILVVFIPDSFVFAQAVAETGAEGNAGKPGNDMIMAISKMLLSFWVFIAIIAGKLMSNEFVYGSVFNLDKYLWLMWNMVKNFANYIIGFTFIALILKGFLTPKEGLTKAKQSLPFLLISSVFVQSSWFLMGALIDISTIMTIAIGSIPTAFMQQSGFEAKMQNTISNIPRQCDYGRDTNDKTNSPQKCDGNLTGKYDIFLAKYNSMSGPLLYMGFSVISLHNFQDITANQTTDATISSATLLKAILVILFLIPIFLLMIVNIIRIVWIRIWVIFSPMIVLDIFLFKHAFNKAYMETAHKGFKVSNIIGLIFQPVAVIACMSVALIIVSSISAALVDNGEENAKILENGLGIKTEGNSASLQGFKQEVGAGSFTINGSLINDTLHKAGGSIGYLIMVCITIMIIWGILQAGFKTSELTSGIADSTFQYVGSLVKSAPIIPNPMGGGGLSIENIKNIPQSLAQAGAAYKDKSVRGLDNTIQGLTGTKGIDLDIGAGNRFQVLNSQNGEPMSFLKASINKLKTELKTKQNVRINSPQFKEALQAIYEKNLQLKAKFNSLFNVENFEGLINNEKFKKFLMWALTKTNELNSLPSIDSLNNQFSSFSTINTTDNLVSIAKGSP